MNLSQTESQARLRPGARTRTQEAPGAPRGAAPPLDDPRSRSPRHFSACTPLAFNSTCGPVHARVQATPSLSPGGRSHQGIAGLETRPRAGPGGGGARSSCRRPRRAAPRATSECLLRAGHRGTLPPCHRHEPIAQSKTTDVGAGRSLGGRTGPQTPGMAAGERRRAPRLPVSQGPPCSPCRPFPRRLLPSAQPGLRRRHRTRP